MHEIPKSGSESLILKPKICYPDKRMIAFTYFAMYTSERSTLLITLFRTSLNVLSHNKASGQRLITPSWMGTLLMSEIVRNSSWYWTRNGIRSAMMVEKNNAVKKKVNCIMVIKQVVNATTVLGHRTIYSLNVQCQSMCPWVVSIGFLAKIPRLGSDIAAYHNKTPNASKSVKPKIVIFAHCPTFGGLERR